MVLAKQPDLHLLNSLESIFLTELDSVRLLNRVDRKYIIPAGKLSEIFSVLKNDQYAVLKIDSHRVFHYRTTYFDTEDLRFYKDHHNHLLRRIKVRTRSYVESDLHFFEIKLKSKARTEKFREALKEPILELFDYQSEKIREIYPISLDKPLVPKLINTYKRITLVNKERTERCTIDIDLAYQDSQEGDREITVHDIAIIEVKQSKASVLMGIVASLRKMQIRPSSISKYAYGLILLNPELKYNALKPLLQNISKIKKEQELNKF